MEDIESSPPAYSSGRNNEENPPSYESLYGRIKVAKREANGKGELIKSICEIITSTGMDTFIYKNTTA